MTEERGSLRPLFDTLGGLLSNPVVLEGLIAGLSAFSASRRTKEAGADSSETQGRSESGSFLDVLPGLLPLLSVMTSQTGTPPAPASSDAAPETVQTPDDGEPLFSAADGNDADANGDADGDTGGDEVVAAALFSDDAPSGGNVTVSYESRESQRENLLLAIRPFLSESRRSATDAMVQVNKLSGLFRGR